MTTELENALNSKNAVDLLYEYATDPSAEIQLTPKLQEQYEDIMLLDKWMVTYRNKRTVVEMFMKRKIDDDPNKKGVSWSTAYHRFALMERVFGKLNRSNKEYRRVFLEEWFTKLLEKMEKAGQWRSIPAMAKVLTDLADLNATDVIPLEVLQNPVPIIAGYHPESVGERLTKDQAEKIREKLSKRRDAESGIEDVDYTEIQ